MDKYFLYSQIFAFLAVAGGILEVQFRHRWQNAVGQVVCRCLWLCHHYLLDAQVVFFNTIIAIARSTLYAFPYFRNVKIITGVFVIFYGVTLYFTFQNWYDVLPTLSSLSTLYAFTLNNNLHYRYLYAWGNVFVIIYYFFVWSPMAILIHLSYIASGVVAIRRIYGKPKSRKKLAKQKKRG